MEKEFEVDNMTFEVIDNLNVRIKKFKGIFGSLRSYNDNKKYIRDSKRIEIPAQVDYCGNSYNVTEICKGLFDNLSEVECLVIPHTVRLFEWGFWKCVSLKNIECKSLRYIRSKDGVLYSADGKTLLVYPNAHGKEYTVDDGIRDIQKFAFKTSNVEEIHLPSTVRKIGVNAFYRCNKLRKIICNCTKEDIEFDGFAGNGVVEPTWEFHNDDKVEYCRAVRIKDQNRWEFQPIQEV